MPLEFEYDAPDDESFAATVQRVLAQRKEDEAALMATLIATKKQLDWKNAASTIIAGVTAAQEFQSNHAFLFGIGVVIVACLSPLQLHLINDEAAELLAIVETNARHRTVNFRRMQEILGGGAAREAVKVLEKAGFVRQEANGDWIIQRIRLASFRVLP